MKQIKRGKCNDEKEERSESNTKKEDNVQVTSGSAGKRAVVLSLLISKQNRIRAGIEPLDRTYSSLAATTYDPARYLFVCYWTYDRYQLCAILKFVRREGAPPLNFSHTLISLYNILK